MKIASKISPCLWFDDQAEAAARFYTGIFPDSKITQTTHYLGEKMTQVSGRPEGSVLTVAFELAGLPFTALNGGPIFKFNEAISLQVHCDSQDELDKYWTALNEGGDLSAQQCGWLKDRYGLSWQIVPAILPTLLTDPARAQRVMEALLPMKKLDIGKLQQAADAASAGTS
ncbi:VOC family protein [Advenella incenata]|jgi:predicted 3-demethylubiquinone-9 3-methyltransferase (glyoxalase superfamily)